MFLGCFSCPDREPSNDAEIAVTRDHERDEGAHNRRGDAHYSSWNITLFLGRNAGIVMVSPQLGSVGHRLKCSS